MTILIIVGIVISITVGCWAGSLQNVEIKRCMKLKKMSDTLLVGKLELKYITDSQLLSLSRPKFTHVGLGGIGPSYIPSFFIHELVMEELSRRRASRILI